MAADIPTLAEFLDEWMLVRQSRLQPYTVRSYRQSIRCYLLPHLGDLRLDELDVRTLDRTYAQLLHSGGKDGKPLAPRTVQYAATILRTALEHALKTGLLERNPAAHATKPRFDHQGDDPALKELNVWTAADVRTFLEKIDGEQFEAIWVLAVCTGMRRGEVLGLRWEDVDLVERTIHVRRAISVVKGEGRLKSTKNSRSRSIRIEDRAVRALVAQRTRQLEERATCKGRWRDEWGLVFTYADGSFINPDTISMAWRNLVRQLDLPVIRLHDLRHTHATLMLQAGVPIKVVADRLGHSEISVTLDTYMHVLPAMDADAVDRFSRLLDGEDSEAARYGSLEGWQAMTLYLPDVLRHLLEETAAADGIAVGDLIRSAIGAMLDGRPD